MIQPRSLADSPRFSLGYDFSKHFSIEDPMEKIELDRKLFQERDRISLKHGLQVTHALLEASTAPFRSMFLGAIIGVLAMLGWQHYSGNDPVASSRPQNEASNSFQIKA